MTRGKLGDTRVDTGCWIRCLIRPKKQSAPLCLVDNEAARAKPREQFQENQFIPGTWLVALPSDLREDAGSVRCSSLVARRWLAKRPLPASRLCTYHHVKEHSCRNLSLRKCRSTTRKGSSGNQFYLLSARASFGRQNRRRHALLFLESFSPLSGARWRSIRSELQQAEAEARLRLLLEGDTSRMRSFFYGDLSSHGTG